MLIVVACLSLFSLSYFRESYFLTLNSVVQGQLKSNSHIDFLYSFFKTIDINKLYIHKWTSTVFFSLIFIGFTLYFLYKYFLNIHYVKIVGYLYLVVIFVVSIVGLISYWLGLFNQWYFILRFIAGIVQSPLVFFFFIPLFSFVNMIKE